MTKEVKIIKYNQNENGWQKVNNNANHQWGNKCEYFRISLIENLWNDLI